MNSDTANRIAYEQRALVIDGHLAEFQGLPLDTIAKMRRESPSEHRRLLVEWELSMDSWYPASPLENIASEGREQSPLWKAWRERENAKAASDDAMRQVNRCHLRQTALTVRGLLTEIAIAAGFLFLCFVLIWLVGAVGGRL